MISKSGISGKYDHGEKAEVVRACKEICQMLSDAPTSANRQKEARKQDGTICAIDQKLFRRPKMMGKTRQKNGIV